MTNFEKWKSELTIEKYSRLVCGDCYSCKFCPAEDSCINGFDSVSGCREKFVKWANAEYVEPVTKVMLHIVLDKPKSCFECDFAWLYNDGDMRCMVISGKPGIKRPAAGIYKFCPLVEVE